MDERIDLSMSDPDLVPLIIQVLSFLLIWLVLATVTVDKNLKPVFVNLIQ